MTDEVRTNGGDLLPEFTRENPAGVFRRVHTEPLPTDEVLRRDLRRHPTDELYRYWLGKNDWDFVEITEEEADTIIARWRRKFGDPLAE
jgi:hypothetical protein